MADSWAETTADAVRTLARACREAGVTSISLEGGRIATLTLGAHPAPPPHVELARPLTEQEAREARRREDEALDYGSSEGLPPDTGAL